MVDVFSTDWTHHAVTERDLSFTLRTLVDTRQEAAGQSQSFLQGSVISVICWCRLQEVLRGHREVVSQKREHLGTRLKH